MELEFNAALKIFANPDNLEIEITRDRGGDRFGAVISRGPKNRLLVLSLDPFEESAEGAIGKVQEVLELSCKMMIKELEKKHSSVSAVLNSGNKKIDGIPDIMNQTLIEKIVHELRDRKKVSTRQILVAR
jgi:hypothetical protein